MDALHLFATSPICWTSLAVRVFSLSRCRSHPRPQALRTYKINARFHFLAELNRLLGETRSSDEYAHVTVVSSYSLIESTYGIYINLVVR